MPRCCRAPLPTPVVPPLPVSTRPRPRGACAALPPHRKYAKSSSAFRGRGNGGKSNTKNSTRGGATATRSTAAVILGNKRAKQQCTKCKSAGRFGVEYVNHKGICPYAVDSSQFTMAPIVISDDDDDDAAPAETAQSSLPVTEVVPAPQPYWKRKGARAVERGMLDE